MQPIKVILYCPPMALLCYSPLRNKSPPHLFKSFKKWPKQSQFSSFTVFLRVMGLYWIKLWVVPSRSNRSGLIQLHFLLCVSLKSWSYRHKKSTHWTGTNSPEHENIYNNDNHGWKKNPRRQSQSQQEKRPGNFFNQEGKDSEITVH